VPVARPESSLLHGVPRRAGRGRRQVLPGRGAGARKIYTHDRNEPGPHREPELP